MSAARTLNIVGCGRLGRVLARLWQAGGVFAVQDVLNRSLASGHDAVAYIGAGYACADFGELRPADAWLIGTGDDTIEASCASLAAAGKLGPGTLVFHCSGALSSTVLNAAAQAGALTASAHPVRSFALPDQAAREFGGTWCGIEGNDLALQWLETALAGIGARTIRIDTEAKTLYHGAAVFASNYLVTLLDVALRAYVQAGVPEEAARAMLQPLVRGTVENVFAAGPERALSGPIARGDFAVVERQQNVIAGWDSECAKLYECFVGPTVKLAARRKSLDQPSE